jgi:hypothetical protein
MARKMNCVLFALIFGLNISNSDAQVINFDSSNEEERTFKLSDGLQKIMDLDEQGSIAITGFAFQEALVIGKMSPYKIWHFDAEGKLIWKKIVPNSKLDKALFLTTPDNRLFYVIQTKANKFYDKTTYLTQVGVVDGRERSLEIEGREEFGKNLQTIFSDSKYLYFITTEDGNEKNGKKKVTEKLVINRFDHQSLIHTKLAIDTPPIQGGDETSFWSFMGVKGENMLFGSKHVDIESGKNDFIVLEVSSDGKVNNTIRFSYKLPADKYSRPSYALNLGQNNFHEIERMDYEIVYGKNYSYTNAFATAFSHIRYNKDTEQFLVYGLYGDKPFHKIGPIYRGLYLSQFDPKGKEIWSTDQPAGDQLMGEGYFKVHARPAERDIEVVTAKENKIVVNISFNDINAPFFFSSDGKFLKSDFIKSKDFDLETFITPHNSKSKDYFESLAKDKTATKTTMITPRGEVLIYFSPKEKVFQTIFFKN